MRLEKKQEVWACEHGCSNSKEMCEHLKKLIPSMAKGKMCISSEADATCDFFTKEQTNWSLDKFKTLMVNYGFTDSWDLDLLVARYFYGMSYRQIEKEMKFISYVTVRTRIKKLHEQLKERGFEQELK